MTEGTDLARLFEGHPPRKYSDMENYARIFGNNLEHMFVTLTNKQEIIDGSVTLLNILIDNFNENGRALSQYSHDHDLDRLVASEDDAYTRFIATIKEKKPCFYSNCTELFEGYLDEICEHPMKSFADLVRHNEGIYKPGELGGLPDHIESLKTYIDLFEGIVDSFEFLTETKQNQISLSEISHYRGYISAEKYADTNPSYFEEAKTLFGIPTTEINERFVREEIFEPYAKLSQQLIIQRCIKSGMDPSKIFEK